MANITNFITLNDFRKGIAGDYFSTSGTTRKVSTLEDGFATIENTFQCHSVDGPLLPMPRKQQGQTKTHIRQGSPAYSTTYYPANQLCSYLIDACVVAPTTRNNSLGVNAGLPTSPYEVFALYAYGQSDATGNNYYLCEEGVRVRPYDSTTIDSFWFARSVSTIDSTLPYVIPGGTIFYGRQVITGTYEFYMIISPIAYVSMVTGGAIASPQTTWTLFDDHVSANYIYANYVQLFPSPDTPGVNSITANTPGSPPAMAGAPFAIVHQSRFVGFYSEYSLMGREDPFGASDTIQNVSSFIAYTPVYDADLRTGSGANLYPTDSWDGGIAAACSINANELFLVFNQGGGMIIRGDLASPTVVKLPFVQSAGGVMSRGVSTPIGVVYLTDSGVYAWQGGQDSISLSPRLDGRFWEYRLDTANDLYGYATPHARLDYFDPFVCVPGNFVFNKNTQSWWRLADPAANGGRFYNTYQYSGWLNRLFAFPYKIDASNSTLYDYYDNETLALTYSWQSQPLMVSLDQYINVTEIELTAQRPSGTSTSTVDITLTGIDELGAQVASPVTVSWNLQSNTADRPAQTFKDIAPNFQARYVQIKIVATSDAVAAPKIYNVRIGYREAKGVVRY